MFSTIDISEVGIQDVLTGKAGHTSEGRNQCVEIRVNKHGGKHTGNPVSSNHVKWQCDYYF